MKNWIRGLAAMALFSAVALGQATPISSTPDQPQSTASAPQKNKPTRKAKVQHAKTHHKSHRKHHKTA
ncbi:MAG TPA: hypothetical protein VMT53_09245 [Terriglobales bacterium]|nr:hypothetical protein [Terriglobales bacterium]